MVLAKGLAGALGNSAHTCQRPCATTHLAAAHYLIAHCCGARPHSQELIGKPLVSAFPYSVVINVDTDDGYSHCGHNASKYAKHAGDPNYNLLNECCLAINDGNPPATAFSTIAQASMDYVITEGPGRTDFVRYWRLMAEAVAQVRTHAHAHAHAHIIMYRM